MTLTVTKNNLSEFVYMLTNRVLQGRKVAVSIDHPEELFMFSNEYIDGQTNDIIPMDVFIDDLRVHVHQKT